MISPGQIPPMREAGHLTARAQRIATTQIGWVARTQHGVLATRDGCVATTRYGCGGARE